MFLEELVCRNAGAVVRDVRIVKRDDTACYYARGPAVPVLPDAVERMIGIDEDQVKIPINSVGRVSAQLLMKQCSSAARRLLPGNELRPADNRPGVNGSTA